MVHLHPTNQNFKPSIMKLQKYIFDIKVHVYQLQFMLMTVTTIQNLSNNWNKRVRRNLHPISTTRSFFSSSYRLHTSRVFPPISQIWYRSLAVEGDFCDRGDEVVVWLGFSQWRHLKRQSIYSFHSPLSISFSLPICLLN